MLARTRNEIRTILHEVLGERGVTVYLFGSWARGDASVVSDIDLAIEADAPLPPGTLARLRERLEEPCPLSRGSGGPPGGRTGLPRSNSQGRRAVERLKERDAAIQRFDRVSQGLRSSLPGSGAPL